MGSLRVQVMKDRNQGPRNFSGVGSQFAKSSEGKSGGEKHSEEEAEKHSGHVDFEIALSEPSGKGSWMCEFEMKRSSLAGGCCLMGECFLAVCKTLGLFHSKGSGEGLD